jgi:hypothetical protein
MEHIEHFIKHFRREGAGIWVCVEATTFELPQGRIEFMPGTRLTSGTRFMNVELARMLDEQYRRTSAQINLRARG